jgi:thiamine transport system ATP-binding protein
VSLSVREVSVSFDGRRVLDRETLDVASGSVLAVVGPSGSGKTTLLRVIAGLQRPDHGRIVIDGDDVTEWPAHRRQVGLVFQDDQLFPHLNVGENVAFGLRTLGWTSSRIAARVTELLTAVGLEDRRDQAVSTLSGGEAKRVALVRTLAPLPRVILLDEPFAGLDDERRTKLAVDLRRMIRDAGVTAILVSHDPADITAVADHVHRLGERIDVREMPVETIRPLRREVLRAGMANQSVDFDGDDEPGTFHLAAVDSSGRVVATSTWLRRDYVGRPEVAAYQLRGMATAVDQQSRGLGARLIEAGLERLVTRGVDLVWANARDAALDFYRRLGFTVHGDGFVESVTQLPHHVVVREIRRRD